MINLTILSFSMSSLYSISPVFNQYNIKIEKSKFQYIFPTIFYNPVNLHVGKTIFQYNTGSVLYSSNIIDNYIKKEGVIYELHDFHGNYSANAKDIQDDVKFVYIHDCIFRDVTDDSYLIYVNKEASFYMTSCSIVQSTCKKTFIRLQEARMALITHICFSDPKTDPNFDHGTPLFLYSNTDGSFIKFVYNTLYGGSTYYSKNKYICHFYASCPIKYQCNNISYFNIYNNDFQDGSIIRYEGPNCLNMLMSTINNANAKTVVYDKLDNGIDDTFSHYVFQCNFIDNSYDHVFLIQAKAQKHMKFSYCVFKNNNKNNNFFKILNPSIHSKVIVDYCKFDSTINEYEKGFALDSGGQTTYVFITKNQIVTDDPEINDLAHYVNYYCEGIVRDNAYGCNNDTCPDNVGCAADQFNPKPDDYIYPTKPHEGFDPPTPTPTVYFTRSQEFSNSIYFTNSNRFNPSSFFSESNEFTKSFSFSDSTDFTKSDAFTLSSHFTKSSDFVKTNEFSNSFFFSESTEFTKSSCFSESAKFDKTDEFSKSFFFSKSCFFSETIHFTKSGQFTETTSFSQTGKFSESIEFSESIQFSESADFTKSKSFIPTNNFNSTDPFTLSLAFTNSNDFSKSGYFSSSKQFTDSSDFTKTEVFTFTENFTYSKDFSRSIQFTRSFDFTKSGYFSGSNLFSSSFYFSESAFFTKTKEFEPSSLFSGSDNFNQSEIFTDSNGFTKSEFFSSSMKFTETFYFSESKEFDPSSIFSGSDHFKPSDMFNDSNSFTKSIYFSNSNKFTKTDNFINTDYFTNSNNFTDSNYFTLSSTLLKKSNVLINIKTDNKSSTAGMKIGVGISFGALGIAAIIIGLIILRRRKLTPVEDINEESVTICEDIMSSTITQNPLANMLDTDDPFEDEFD